MSRGDTREGEEGPSAMAVAGGLKLDGRLLIMASAVFTVSLLLLRPRRRQSSGDPARVFTNAPTRALVFYPRNDVSRGTSFSRVDLSFKRV